jgi:hypothetical protein
VVYLGFLKQNAYQPRRRESWTFENKMRFHMGRSKAKVAKRFHISNWMRSFEIINNKK